MTRFVRKFFQIVRVCLDERAKAREDRRIAITLAQNTPSWWRDRVLGLEAQRRLDGEDLARRDDPRRGHSERVGWWDDSPRVPNGPDTIHFVDGPPDDLPPMRREAR